MRHSIKRISKSALSVILALMMIVSTMLVGAIASANAATTGSVTSNGSAILFFNRSAVSWWSATGNFAYFYNSSNKNAWSENAIQYSDSIYYVNIPSGTWDHVILTRNSATSNPSFSDGNSVEGGTWNKTGDIALSTDNNYISSFSENSDSVTWSTVKPTSKAALSASSSSVDVNTAVTLTPELTDNTTYNAIKYNSYSVKLDGSAAVSGTDYSISGNTFTPKKAGTFTVSDNITYNAKGYSTLTSTVSASTTITVTSATTELVKPSVSLTDNGIVTSDKSVTLTVSNASDYPADANVTYKIYDSSNNVKASFTGATKTIAFNDVDLPAGTYTLKAVAGNTASYSDSVASDSFTITKTQLYSVTLEANADAEVIGTYTDAYGVTGKTINEGETAKVPSGNKVNVKATLSDTTDKTFNRFSYNSSEYFTNPADIAITANGTISTVIDTVTYRTVKIAVISYADNTHHSSGEANYLGSNNVTYSFGGSTKTAAMTSFEADPTAYFAIPKADAGNWNGNGHTFYIYEVNVPSTVNSIKVDNKVTFTLDDTTEYYAVYNYGGWKTAEFTTSDRYYEVKVVADKTVDNAATVSASGTESVAYSPDTTKTLYKYNSTINLTATPSNTSAFSLDRWNDGTTDITSPYTVVSDATLTAYFKANQAYDIILDDSVSHLASITSSPSGSTYEGNKVIVTITPEEGYKCVGVSFTPNVPKEYKGNGVYEFTMPGEPVKIIPFISAKDQYTVTAVSNDETKGTVSPASTTVYEEESVTLKATPTGTNAFSKWEITGTYTISSGSLTDSEIKIVPTSDVSAKAIFIENQGTVDPNLHFLYGTDQNPSAWNKSLPVYKLSSGEHVVRFNVDEMSKNQNYFGALSSSTSYTNMYWTNKSQSDFEISSTDTSLVTADYNNFGNYKFVYFNIKKDLSSLTMRVGTEGPLYELQPESAYGPIPTDGIKIYAKNGAKSGSTYFGTTVAEKGNNSSTVTLAGEESAYNLYSATKGSVVKITTTMSAADRYVHAFVINGKTYRSKEGTNNSYFTEFPVEEGVSAYEVTPVYYVNACKTKGEYITFYVDSSELEGTTLHWGNTIASYAYYYKKAGSTESYESDGNYPGQPMLYDEGQGRYYCRVPKTMSGQPVSGITINDYKNDAVHATLNPELTVNEQSYDYNDFKIIAESGYDIIRFDMKPRTSSTTNRSIVDKNQPFNYETYKNNNGWNYLVDNNGNRVGVLGNRTDPNNPHKLYVVSTAADNIAGVGQWPIKRYVYDETGKLVTSGIPSDFIARPNAADNTAAYNAIVDGGYVGAPTEITFESRKTYDSNATGRLDGRWYYAKSSSSVSADVKYRTSEDGTTYGKPLTNTSYATVNGKDSVTFETHGNSIYLAAMPIEGYVFSHWSLASGWSDELQDYTSYRDLSTTLTSSFTTTLDAESHYVANYVKATEGSINISHVKYDASDAKGGMGYYYVKAYVVKEDGTQTEVVSGTGSGVNGQSITLNDITNADKKIVITITTTTAGENTFRYWYTTSSYGYEIINDPDGDMTANGVATEDPYGTIGTVTYTFETDISKLFNHGRQVINELHFYSDIAPVSKEYKLTYKYLDRFGSEKSYVVTGKHDDQYYTDNNNSWAPNEALIYENAPAIDDLYKDCKWTMTNCSIDGTDATLVAEQVGKLYNVRIYDADGLDGTFDKYTLPMNSYVKTATGKYYVAEATHNNKKFLYWSIMEDGIEVARHYYQEFTRVILGNYDIIPIYGDKAEDAISIADPQYTREQSTNADGTVVADKLYVDFMVAYMSASGELIRDDASGTKYQKSGILIEIGQNKTLGTNPDGTINPDYSSIKFDSDEAQLKAAIQTDNGTSTNYKYNGDSADRRKVFNYTIDNSDYNNMNRFDYFVYFKNTDANQKYVMKAYYYVIVDGEIMLSSPVYFNLYEVGNSTPTTVS